MLSLSEIPLSSANFSWFVVGGWALDLYLNRQTRIHADIDLGILRRDQHLLREFLSDWELRQVAGGVLTPWEKGEELHSPVHEIHARKSGLSEFEILLSEASANEWIYRRNPKIRRLLRDAIALSPSGIPVLAPEIVLLFKSKAPAQKDQTDFEIVLPALSQSQRKWLSDALQVENTSHMWNDALGA